MSTISFPGGFTVLMAVYGQDNPSLFQCALASVYDNSLKPDALLLVVDGKVPIQIDNVIAKFEVYPNFKVLRLDQNVGLARALNAGIELVETEWIVRADSDDFNLPDRFMTQAQALADHSFELDIFGSAILEVDFDGKGIASRRLPERGVDIQKFAVKRNPFNHMTVAVRTQLVRSAGGYPAIGLKEDYALWVKLLSKRVRSYNIPRELVNATTGMAMYRRRGGLKYALSEVQMQRHLVSCGLKTGLIAFIDGSIRAIVFLMPAFMRSLVYKHFLRS